MSTLYPIQLCDELPHVLVRHRLDREKLQLVVRDVLHGIAPSAVTGKITWIVAHNRLPLTLRHIVNCNLKVSRDIHFLTGPPFATPTKVGCSLWEAHESH